MKLVNLKSLIALAALAFGLFAAGCADKGNSSREPVLAGTSGGGGGGASGFGAGPGPGAGANSGAGGASFGTSDSGGGTGVAGKVFESYIVDPLQLPAYKQFIEPLLKNIKADKPGESVKFELFFKIKTWYIAPVEFDKIGKEALGISFVQSNTEQIARQSLKEVWINETILGKMDLRKQAELHLHEMVMSMYFYKFLTLKEICKTVVLLSNGKDKEGCGSAADIALLEKMMPPEKLRALNDEDNENIRFVTGWMLQNLDKPIQESEFVRVLAAKGFDHRMFNPKNYSADPTEESFTKITSKELYDTIHGAKLTGHMPRFCTGMNHGKTKDCHVQVTPTDIAFQGVKLPGLRLTVEAEGEKPVSLNFNVGDEQTLSIFSDGDRGNALSLAAIDTVAKVKLGDRLYSAFFVFRKEENAAQSGLTLDYIVLKPSVIVSVDKKREQNPCHAREPRVVDFFDDVILIKREGFREGFADKMIVNMPPLVYCSTANID